MIHATPGSLRKHRLIVDRPKTVWPHELAAIVHVGHEYAATSGIERHVVEINGRDRELIGTGEEVFLAFGVDTPNMSLISGDKGLTREDDARRLLQATQIEPAHLARCIRCGG